MASATETPSASPGAPAAPAASPGASAAAGGPGAPGAPASKIDEQVSYNGMFLVLALGFGAVTFWAVWDEAYSRRPWKNYQAEFFRIEEQAARKAYQDEKRRLEQDQALADKRKELARLEGEIGSPGPARDRHLEAKAEIERLQYEAFDAEQNFTFAKSEWEEAYYWYTKAKHGGQSEEVRRTGVALRAAQQEMDRLKAISDEAAARRDAKAEEAAASTARIDELGKELESARIELDRLRLVWEKARARADKGTFAAEIVQLDLLHIGRVDRCQSCHMGIDRSGFEEVRPEMYRTHPLRRTLLRSHPVERFGCTICHGGQGRATEIKESLVFGHVDYVHAPGDHTFHRHYWEEPLLRGPSEQAGDWYVESRCQHCHAREFDLRSEVWCEQDVECKAETLVEQFGGELTCAVPAGRPADADRTCVDDAGEPVYADLAPHQSKGRKLIEELGCYGCHAISGYEHLPKPAPDLRRVAAKVDPGWLVEWIKHPRAIRPRTRMPNFWPEAVSTEGYARAALSDADGNPIDFVRLRDEESRAIAAYLLAKSQPFELAPAPPGDAERGRKLVDTLGCHGCHAIPPDPVEHRNRASRYEHGPDLSGIGSKTSQPWLYAWLRNPRHYSPGARMPNLRLTEQEAADVAALLASWKDDRGYPRPAGLDPLDAGLVARGEKVIGTRGCFGCHLIPGFEERGGIGAELSDFGVKTVDRLDFGDHISDHHQHTWDRWLYHKLKHPRVYRYERVDALMPQFDLQDDEIWAIMTAMRGKDTAAEVGDLAVRLSGADALRAEGREWVRYYNCYGCHTMDGFTGDIRRRYPADESVNAPPLLAAEGAKTRPEWLFEFLKDVKLLRPWLSVRMPTFGLTDRQATALVAMFSSIDGAAYPYLYEGDLPRPDAERAQVAERTFGLFRCTQCHAAGALPRLSPELPSAPDLALARERLRPEWVVEWLRDPQPLMPGTKMPNFFGTRSEPSNQLQMMLQVPAYADLFGALADKAREIANSTDDTMRLLRDYLMTTEMGQPAATRAPGAPVL